MQSLGGNRFGISLSLCFNYSVNITNKLETKKYYGNFFAINLRGLRSEHKSVFYYTGNVTKSFLQNSFICHFFLLY